MSSFTSDSGHSSDSSVTSIGEPSHERSSGVNSQLFVGISSELSLPSNSSASIPLSKSISTPIPNGIASGKIEFVAETNLPTQKGHYRIRAYRAESGGEPLAIIYGSVEGGKDIPVRVHDQCFTSEVIGSLRCDCQKQLSYAMEYIKNEKNCPGGGMVIYLPQEGRGIGLANKIAAYAAQEVLSLDTVDANRILGFHDDHRSYDTVAQILEDLSIESIQLMTNNPRKIERLSSLGISITNRLPCIVSLNEYSSSYVSAKASRMSHMIDTGEIEANTSKELKITSPMSAMSATNSDTTSPISVLSSSVSPASVI